MYKAITSGGTSGLANLKMKAVTSHYDKVVKGTKLEEVLERSRILMPDEHLNLYEELALARDIAGEALKDYIFAKELPESPKSREMLACAGAILNDKLKTVKEMCISASQMQSNIRGFNPSTISYAELLAYIMHSVKNNANIDDIESELRLNLCALNEEKPISKPSEDKIVTEMDMSVPKNLN
jgi:hypothetical protein